MNEIVPLEQVAEAYERMMSGKARFRVVLSVESQHNRRRSRKCRRQAADSYRLAACALQKFDVECWTLGVERLVLTSDET
jgi:hypothetical protein